MNEALYSWVPIFQSFPPLGAFFFILNIMHGVLGPLGVDNVLLLLLILFRHNGMSSIPQKGAWLLHLIVDKTPPTTCDGIETAPA